MSQKKSSRIVEFDAMRGIASVLVMAHHGILAFDESYWTSGRQFRLTPLAALEVGRPMVVFFFVLSGVVLTRALMNSQRMLTLTSFASYVVQRIIRLCIPAAAATLLSFGLYVAAFGGMGPWTTHWLQGNWLQPPSVPEMLRHALLLGDAGEFPYDNVLWSLAHELRISIFIPVLVALPLLRRPRGWLGLALLGFAVPALAGVMHPTLFQALLGASLLQTSVISLYFTGAFMVGAAYAIADAGPRFRGSRPGAVAVTMLILGLLCVTYDPSSVLVAVLILWLAEQKGLFAKVLRQPVLQMAGKFSFSLYLVHVPVLLAVTQTLGVGWIGIVAYVGFAVPATAVVFYGAERPAHRLARIVGALSASREQPVFTNSSP